MKKLIDMKTLRNITAEIEAATCAPASLTETAISKTLAGLKASQGLAYHKKAAYLAAKYAKGVDDHVASMAYTANYYPKFGVKFSDLPTVQVQKGTTVTDSDIGLGREIKSKKDLPRGAALIPCAPVTLGEWMQPGVPVVVRDGVAFAAHGKEEPIGVVDPFLPGGCPKGAKVWVMLDPSGVSGMRYEWAHPAFLSRPAPTKPAAAVRGTPAQIAAARNRLHMMGEAIGKTYDGMVQLGHWYFKHGYAHVGSKEAADFMNSAIEEFWNDWTLVTGVVLRQPPSSTIFNA